MARSCGIRIGPRRFELVVLDGSPKRHKISAYHVGEFSAEDAAAYEDGDVSGVAASLKEAAKSHRIPLDNVSIVVASDHAAFRHLTLPFSDKQKIEQVLKFEIESELPHFDIDDVIVDYQVMDQDDSAAELLVTAVPKDDVQRAISACEKAGIEPLEVEHEGTAMVNAAFAADMCHIDDAQVLVHIGEHSSCVAVVAGAELREFRTIHIGAMTHLAKELQIAGGAAEADAEGEDAEALASEVDPADAERRVDQAIKRIRREIGRTISAARTPQTIEAIYACGMELPGLIGSEVLGVPVYVLDCFDADSGQPADGFGELVAPYGGAYRQLGGGVLKPSLRREELRYTGTWERLEFPIAFAALMLATFLGMLYIIQMRTLNNMSYAVRRQVNMSNLYIVGDPDNVRSNPIMEPLPGKKDSPLLDWAKAYRDLSTFELPEGAEPPLVALADIKKELIRLNGKAGEGFTSESFKLPPSAFSAMTLVMGVMGEGTAKSWRPSLRGLTASYVKANRDGSMPEHVKVDIDATFFADDSVQATSHLNQFRRALEAQPWCLGVEMPQTDPIQGDEGLNFSGMKILVNPNVEEQAG